MLIVYRETENKPPRAMKLFFVSLNMWVDKDVCLIQTNSQNSDEHANTAYMRDIKI